MSFSVLGLSPSLCTPLARLGYHQPTPIQTSAIPIVLAGGDLLARAQTGTGKTAAFGLPMIDRLIAQRPRSGNRTRPIGLVLVPTRELALQVHKSLATYGAGAGLRVTAVFGGVSMHHQTQALRRGTDIVVATPGRLIDHLDRKIVDISGIEILTLDEADRMLDMGFRPQLRRLLTALPKSRQTLLFSATLSDDVVRLSADYTHDPSRVDVTAEVAVATSVTHSVHPVAEGQKGALLAHVLRQPPVGQALVFCKTKRGSNRVGEMLERNGVKTAVIHGNKSQGARTRALADFKAGKVAALVATDIAARGLDIAQLPLVVNYDLPLVPADYIHRVGRTGRAGVTGRAVSLVSHADRPLLRDIERLLPDPIERVLVEGFEQASSAEPTPRISPAPRHRSRPHPGHRARHGAASPGSRPPARSSRRPRASSSLG